MSKFDKAPAVFCEIVDGCRQWKQTWSDLAYTLDWQTPVHTNYVIHRVGDPNVWGDLWWTPILGQKRGPSLDRVAALKIEESQCLKPARVTHPA